MSDVETVTIPKDEYIALLQYKAAHLEASQAPVFTPRDEAHSWMNEAERAEIKRLAKAGKRTGEIAKRVNRPNSTVRRHIAQLRESGEL